MNNYERTYSEISAQMHVEAAARGPYVPVYEDEIEPPRKRLSVMAWNVAAVAGIIGFVAIVTLGGM